MPQAAYNTFLSLASLADSTAFTTEATTNDRSNYWRISDSVKSVWDHRETFVVEVSADGGSTWTTLTSADFELLFWVGVVDISAYASAGAVDTVRISGQYLPHYRVIEGHSHGFDFEADDSDVTVYGNTGRARDHGLKNVSGSFEVRRIDPVAIDEGTEKTLEQLFEDGDVILFGYSPDTSETLVARAVVKLFGHNMGVSVADVVNKSLAFQGAYQPAAMEGQTTEIGYVYYR